MPETHTTVPVYRIENPNIHRAPDGVTSHSDLVGEWFSPNIDTALNYLRKSTQTFGPNATPVDGAQLVIANVPSDQLDAMHVSRHPIAAGMDVESDNYVVPRDGDIPTKVVPLDEAIGDLRGKLGNINDLREARRRIHTILGGVAVDN